VPTLLSWPGTLGRNQVADEPVVTMDWTATFLELAGAGPDPAYPLDGTSLVPYLFEGEARQRHDLFFRMRGQRALRRGDLKYVRLTDGRDVLYDVVADPHEQANLAVKRARDLAALRAAWEAVDADLLPYPS
jgi:arylsulfatase A-like enzyme